MIKIYTKYIFKKNSILFLFVVAMMLFLIMFTRSISLLRYVTESVFSIGDFFYMSMLLAPWMLVFIIPFSLMISILISYHRMILSNEITILKLSGLTKLQIIKPTIVLGIIASICSLMIAFYLMPFSAKKLRIKKHDAANNYINLVISPSSFETFDKVTIYVNERDESGNLRGVFINDRRNENQEINITSKLGKVVFDRGSIMMLMEEGTIQRFNRAEKKLDLLSFDSYTLNLSETKPEENKFSWSRRERYPHELLEKTKTDEKRLEYLFEFNRRICYSMLPLLFCLVSTSIMLRGAFSRVGGIYNVILSIVASALAFFSINITVEMIANSQKYTLVPYSIMVLISVVSIYLLISNRKPARK